MITQITDHVAQSKARLREQYKNVPEIVALIDSWTGQIQELEDIIFAMSVNRSVLQGEGVQLDLIGQILNVPRDARNDDDYRIALLAKIAQNVSSGTPEDVISIFKLITESAKVYLSNNYNGEVYLLADHPLTQDEVNAMLRDMYRVVGAGVRIQGLGSFDPDDSFAFAGPDLAKGFGSVYDNTKGGKLATLRRGNEKKFAFAGTNESYGGFGTVYDKDVGGVLISVND